MTFFLLYNFFINIILYIFDLNNIKIDKMITQKDTLKAEIRLLETQLQHAALFQDAFSQIRIYKELEEKKSILDTLQWM